MAKCPVCQSKKGKRRCLLHEEPICSQCCGSIRRVETCSGCEFFKDAKRNYGDAPRFTVTEMQSLSLQEYGNTVEGALVMFDTAKEQTLKDKDAIRIIEALIDIHWFGDWEPAADSELIVEGVQVAEAAIEEDFKDEEVDRETLVKVLGAIRFVANRRAKTRRGEGREYLSLIHRYVGVRVGEGMRRIEKF